MLQTGVFDELFRAEASAVETEEAAQSRSILWRGEELLPWGGTCTWELEESELEERACRGDAAAAVAEAATAGVVDEPGTILYPTCSREDVFGVDICFCSYNRSLLSRSAVDSCDCSRCVP